jgi:hypothetical protein
MKQALPYETIETKIYLIRGQKVMSDSDLAELYGVPTKVLIQSVKRNVRRFPSDFMFKLTPAEYDKLRSQFVTSRRGGRRYLPYVFTELGVAMLSSVLNSERAIQVNIQIIRTFTKIREMIIGYAGIKRKIDEMEKRYDHQFKIVFDAIRQLMVPSEKKKEKISFRTEKS